MVQLCFSRIQSLSGNSRFHPWWCNHCHWTCSQCCQQRDPSCANQLTLEVLPVLSLLWLIRPHSSRSLSSTWKPVCLLAWLDTWCLMTLLLIHSIPKKISAASMSNHYVLAYLLCNNLINIIWLVTFKRIICMKFFS